MTIKGSEISITHRAFTCEQGRTWYIPKENYNKETKAYADSYWSEDRNYKYQKYLFGDTGWVYSENIDWTK